MYGARGREGETNYMYLLVMITFYRAKERKKAVVR